MRGISWLRDSHKYFYFVCVTVKATEIGSILLTFRTHVLKRKISVEFDNGPNDFSFFQNGGHLKYVKKGMSWKSYYFWNTVNPNKSCKTIIIIIKQIGSLSKICNVIKINQTELQYYYTKILDQFTLVYL